MHLTAISLVRVKAITYKATVTKKRNFVTYYGIASYTLSNLSYIKASAFKDLQNWTRMHRSYFPRNTAAIITARTFQGLGQPWFETFTSRYVHCVDTKYKPQLLCSNWLEKTKGINANVKPFIHFSLPHNVFNVSWVWSSAS